MGLIIKRGFIGLVVSLITLAALGNLAHANGWDEIEIAWQCAQDYAYTTWTCNADNTEVDCSTDWQCVWSVGDEVTGVAYDWGGFFTIDEFTTQLSEGQGAGCLPDYNILDCTTGVDCSGLVSKVWGLSAHITTRSMSSHVQTLDSATDHIFRGYGWLKDGHVMVADDHSGVGDYNIIDSSVSKKKVAARTVDSSYIEDYDLVRNSAWIYPDSKIEYCWEENGCLTWKMVSEDGIDSYNIMASNSVSGPWIQIASQIPVGTNFYCTGQGTYSFYLLNGHANGKDIELSVAQPGNGETKATFYEGAPVARAKNQRLQPVTSGAIGVIAPISWANETNQLINYWQQEYGYNVEVYWLPTNWPLQGQGGNGYEFARYILKQTISGWYQNSNVRYVCLVGDFEFNESGTLVASIITCPKSSQ